MTRDPDFNHKDVLVRQSIFQVLAECRNELELVVIGGEQIYNYFLPYTDRIYLTEIDHSFDADAFFPQLDKSEWGQYFSQQGDQNSEYNYRFNVYKRKLK
jgi:dihydrofolate reductase